jgi:hypothetical protein
LIDKAHIAINGNNNVVNNITNNVTNHITFPDSGHRGFVQPAHERDVCFNRAGKLWLMDKPTASLDRIMNMVHCGEYDFFKNVIITNLTKKYAYKYDKSAKNFTKVDKTILLDAIVSGGSPIWKKYTRNSSNRRSWYKSRLSLNSIWINCWTTTSPFTTTKEI